MIGNVIGIYPHLQLSALAQFLERETFGQRHVYGSPVWTAQNVPPRVAIGVRSRRHETRSIKPPRSCRTVDRNHRMGKFAVAHTVGPPSAAVNSSTQVKGHQGCE